jgi:hypothetical protein
MSSSVFNNGAGASDAALYFSFANPSFILFADKFLQIAI